MYMHLIKISMCIRKKTGRFKWEIDNSSTEKFFTFFSVSVKQLAPQ